MKATRATGKYQFHLSRHEQRMLFQLLALYARIPPAHQPLSRSGAIPDAQASQRLLEEALAEHRAENRRQIQTILADPQRFEATQAGAQLILSEPEVDWLLQVLNDIRVGSWLLLGSPEADIKEWDESAEADVWAMAVSGLFEAEVLRALAGGGEARPPG